MTGKIRHCRELSDRLSKIRIFLFRTPFVPPGRVLLFSGQCPIFADNKHDKNMKLQESVTNRLFRLLETDRTLPDFPTACRRLHVLPGALNEALLRESGICGEELILRQQKE